MKSLENIFLDLVKRMIEVVGEGMIIMCTLAGLFYLVFNVIEHEFKYSIS